MNLNELNPHIRHAANVHMQYLRTKKDISVCYDCRIFFFENASGNMTINGEKYAVSHQTAVFLPPEQKYKFNILIDKETKIIVINFDLTSEYSHIKSSLGTANLQNFDPSITPKYSLPLELSNPIIKILPQIYVPLKQCTNNFLIQGSFFRERSSALLKLCLLEFADINSLNKRSELCDKILEYVHKNYSQTTLTNEEIAEILNYHPYHINRVVKRETGKSLKSYIINYRIQKAKELLLATNYNISEISFQTGFCSSAYFTKIFNEKNGITPKEYRRLHLHTEI